MSKAKKTGDLTWSGTAFLLDIPARDLRADELDQYGGYDALIATGLYSDAPANSVQALDTPAPAPEIAPIPETDPALPIAQ